MKDKATKKKKRNGSGTRMTKAQLEEALKEVQKTAKKQANELTALQKELGEAETKIKAFKELEENLELAEMELEEAQKKAAEAKKLQQGIDSLQRKLEDIEASSEKEIEQLNLDLRESERQRQTLEQESKRLEEELAELKSEEQIYSQVAKDASASKATFLIHIYPTQGHYQGKIEHPLTRARRAFSRLDESVIMEFISQYLPEREEEAIVDQTSSPAAESGSAGEVDGTAGAATPPEEKVVAQEEVESPEETALREAAQQEAPEQEAAQQEAARQQAAQQEAARQQAAQQKAARQKAAQQEAARQEAAQQQAARQKAAQQKAAKEEKIQEQLKNAVLQEVRFQQLQHDIQPGQTLRAHRPFTLFTRLNFPIAPSASNMDIDSNTYNIQVVAADAQASNVIFRNGVTDYLTTGITEYKDRIPFAALNPGTYVLRIHAFAPFAQIEESKDIRLTVA